jgi:hypothetical protein
MRSRFEQHDIECTTEPDPMACAEGALLQHYFQEDELPNRANFYVAVKVHNDDAVEEELEDGEYDSSDEDSDDDGDSDEDEGIFMGPVRTAKLRVKRPRPDDDADSEEKKKDIYLSDRTKMIGSYKNEIFKSMEPVPMEFHVDADGKHLGRIHVDLFWSKRQFEENTPLKDDAGNLIPFVRSYPLMFADLDDLKAKGFEVHPSDDNSPSHFKVRAVVKMTGSSEQLILTLYVMKPDYEFPPDFDGSDSTFDESDCLFEHRQEVWSKGCSHFTSNTTGTSSSSGADSAEAVEPTREVRKRQCKR